NGDGIADDAVDFAQTRTGGMGLCFDGNDLLFTGDGGLWRFADADGDGRADGPPTKLVSIEFGEHGGHAPRRGPDGLWVPDRRQRLEVYRSAGRSAFSAQPADRRRRLAAVRSRRPGPGGRGTRVS